MKIQASDQSIIHIVSESKNRKSMKKGEKKFDGITDANHDTDN